MNGLPMIVKIEQSLVYPLEKHTADSKWQFCNCRSCQEIRGRLDSMSGPKIDYATYRHRDERY